MLSDGFLNPPEVGLHWEHQVPQEGIRKQSLLWLAQSLRVAQLIHAHICIQWICILYITYVFTYIYIHTHTHINRPILLTQICAVFAVRRLGLRDFLACADWKSAYKFFPQFIHRLVSRGHHYLYIIRLSSLSVLSSHLVIVAPDLRDLAHL